MEQIMHRVITLAQEAKTNGELPMAAVLVKDGKVVYECTDRSIALSDPTAHAELQAIREYCQREELISLEGVELYTLVEPCVMCAGGIKWARIDRVVFALSQHNLQAKSGGLPKPSCAAIVNTGGRKIEVIAGLLRDEAQAVFADYVFPSKKQLHQQRKRVGE